MVEFRRYFVYTEDHEIVMRHDYQNYIGKFQTNLKIYTKEYIRFSILDLIY